MTWMLVVLILRPGGWEIPPQQYPASFQTEKECLYWAETIQRGWQRVASGYTYAVACSQVYVSKGD